MSNEASADFLAVSRSCQPFGPGATDDAAPAAELPGAPPDDPPAALASGDGIDVLIEIRPPPLRHTRSMGSFFESTSRSFSEFLVERAVGNVLMTAATGHHNEVFNDMTLCARTASED